MSDKAIDVGVLELLASKICHDLISPIGAINNGIEFMEDMGADAGPEAAALIAFSAGQASAKLQAYRLAYGTGGADANHKSDDVHKTIELIVGGDKKIKQAWDPKAPLGAVQTQRGFCKVLTCTLLLAMETLPKGGTLAVSAGKDNSVVVTAGGVGAALRGQTAEALALTLGLEGMDPKYVHAYMTGLMARRYGFSIAPEEAAEGLAKIVIKPLS